MSMCVRVGCWLCQKTPHVDHCLVVDIQHMHANRHSSTFTHATMASDKGDSGSQQESMLPTMLV